MNQHGARNRAGVVHNEDSSDEGDLEEERGGALAPEDAVLTERTQLGPTKSKNWRAELPVSTKLGFVVAPHLRRAGARLSQLGGAPTALRRAATAVLALHAALLAAGGGGRSGGAVWDELAAGGAVALAASAGSLAPPLGAAALLGALGSLLRHGGALETLGAGSLKIDAQVAKRLALWRRALALLLAAGVALSARALYPRLSGQRDCAAGLVCGWAGVYQARHVGFGVVALLSHALIGATVCLFAYSLLLASGEHIYGSLPLPLRVNSISNPCCSLPAAAGLSPGVRSAARRDLRRRGLARRSPHRLAAAHLGARAGTAPGDAAGAEPVGRAAAAVRPGGGLRRRRRAGSAQAGPYLLEESLLFT